MATVGTLTSATLPDSIVHAGLKMKDMTTSRTVDTVLFEPSKHLSHTTSARVHNMEEFGYSQSRGISPVEVFEPFPWSSSEAIQQTRKKSSANEVFSKWKYSSEPAQGQLRGYAADCAPVVGDAWKKSETLAIIPKLAGAGSFPPWTLK
ncbi:uncharacterized protein DSM5745_11334 [Aspergillus mulundensis]|uniref:Uncharacterized protein n=1 Tax=Aspergillus mulundensis TaxID=1810919 RepID=A0A3D8Q935_9EURO|nr:hypothetical protein DSM5745_11334 [Aspergillus mulundensis]RDW57954.1 hypothetical protein DSM5745_11334 [Aspergillus mulundensis]